MNNLITKNTHDFIKGYVASDMEELRSTIHLGDEYRAMRLTKDKNGNVVEKWENVRATGKYPHLITVAGTGPKYPIRTITYIDILTDPRYSTKA